VSNLSTSTEPRVIKQRRAALEAVRGAQADGKSVGVVMTMGALHAGHISLVKRCREECDLTLVTIFVNPTQFLPGEDFQKYPRELEDDLRRLQSVGADIVFAPSTDEMYPPGASTGISPPVVSQLLEGEHRPGHYEGVCTIVCKLFQTIPADRAYFGSKDYQQYLVIKQMTVDLDIPVEVIPCEIIRDIDGLAKSSRNRYLSENEREQSLSLSGGLRAARDLAESGETSVEVLLDRIRDEMTSAGVTKIDYVAIADPETLQPVTRLDAPAIALIAAHVGATRLIDNELLRPSGD